MLRVLVTSVGGDIGRDVVRSLRGYDQPLYLIGCDMDRYSVSIPLLDTFLVAPPVKDENLYVDFLLKVCKEQRCDVLCPASEREMAVIDRQRSKLSGMKLMMVDSPILRVALDKQDTAQWLEKNGLPFAKTFVLSEFKDQLPWPVILKNRSGSGSKGLSIAHDAKELEVYGRSIEKPIVQENLGTPDEEYTVAVFSDGKTTRTIQFHRKLGFGGLSRTARRVNDPALLDLTQKIAGKLSLQGSINIQLRKTTKGYVPFEINPRLSSTVYMRHCLGFKDACWWLAMLEGRTLPYTPREGDVLAVRLVNEVFFDVNEAKPIDPNPSQEASIWK